MLCETRSRKQGRRGHVGVRECSARSSRVSITLRVANLTSRRFNQLHFTSGLFWLQLCPQNARHLQCAVEIGLSADIAQHTSEPIVVITVAKVILSVQRLIVTRTVLIPDFLILQGTAFKYIWRVCSGFSATHTLGSSSYAK